MKWTKEIPTVDGWYWIRRTDDNEVWVGLVKDCWHMEWDCEDGNYRKFTDFREFSMCEFSGPLEEPK
ncbi:hypothetical protein D3C85_881470 [compost metagenome]